MHMALLKLESMPKPEKKTTNSPAYVMRNQKERQMTLQNLNIDWSGLNKTEALRQYNVNCTRQHTITEESNDSIQHHTRNLGEFKIMYSNITICI